MPIDCCKGCKDFIDHFKTLSFNIYRNLLSINYFVNGKKSIIQLLHGKFLCLGQMRNRHLHVVIHVTSANSGALEFSLPIMAMRS